MRINFRSYRIVLKCCDVGLDSLLHVPSSNQGSSQVDVTINEVWFQTNSMSVIFQCFLKLSSLLVDITKIWIGLSQERILLYSQSTKICRPASSEYNISVPVWLLSFITVGLCQFTYLSSRRHWKWMDESNSNTPVLLLSWCHSCMQCRSAFS